MGSPSTHQRLTTASIVWIGGLAAVNLLLVVYFLFWQTPEPVPATPVGVDVSEAALRLLGELSEEERSALARPVAEPRSLPQELIVEAQKVCRGWGPFTDMAVLEGIRQQVVPEGEALEIHSTEVASAPDYLVFLESDNNLDNARRLLMELESQSIDAYVIAGGEFVNSVSAGVFSSEVRANRQMQTLTDLGYVPQMVSLERVQTVHRLTAMVPEDFQVEGHEVVSQESSDCAAIARAR
jgi:hypothetical protein